MSVPVPDRWGAFTGYAPRFHPPGEGPLAGVRVGVKANLDVEGLVTHAGTRALACRPPARADAPAVAALRAAGAVIAGHLNMDEAALGAATDNPWWGPTLNPWGQGLTPGGSSGGSGAAVAAGLVDIALGTDTLGSVRIPAAYCGVYGLKPTNGLVPGDGLVPCHPAFDCIGPLAPSVEGLRAAMVAIAPPAPAPPIARVGLPAPLDAEADVLAATAQAAAMLGRLGLPPVPIAPPFNWDALRLAGFIEAARASARHFGPELADPNAFSRTYRRLLDYAAAVPPEDLARHRAVIASARAWADALFADIDAILIPTAPQPAFRHGARAPTSQARYTAFANIVGAPALALPAGLDAAGLPVSVQIVGRPRSDAAVLDLAARLDGALDGYRQPPGYQGARP